MNRKRTILEVDATLDYLEPVREGVCAAALSCGYSEEQVIRIELVVEEAFLNVVHHAYHDQGGAVVVACELTDSGLFQVTIIDQAPPFLGSAGTLQSVDDPLEIRQPGGCGMTLIRSMTRSAVWQREDDRNTLSVLFDRPAVAGAD